MKRILLIGSVLVAACAVSCKKETKVEDAVTIKTDEQVVPVEGGVLSIAINSTVAWTAKASESWVTLSPTSGEAGDATVKASVLKNDTNDSRTATVTFTAGTKTATYSIVQDQLNALNIAQTEYEVPAEGGTVEVKVSANVDYQVIIPEAVDWVENATTRGLTESTVVLKVAPTTEIEARTANITISDGTLSSTVKITQAPFVPFFDYAGDWAGLQWSFYDGTGPTVIPQEGADITIDVSTNLEWRAFFSVWDNDQGAMVDSWDLGWAKLSYTENQIHLVIEANDTYVPRENYLYAECMINGAVSGEYGGLSRTVSFPLPASASSGPNCSAKSAFLPPRITVWPTRPPAATPCSFPTEARSMSSIRLTALIGRPSSGRASLLPPSAAMMPAMSLWLRTIRSMPVRPIRSITRRTSMRLR